MANKHTFDILYMQADCLYRYSRMKRKSFEDAKADFDKYRIFKYISDCYGLLEHFSTKELMTDICRRIKEGVVFDKRYMQ